MCIATAGVFPDDICWFKSRYSLLRNSKSTFQEQDWKWSLQIAEIMSSSIMGQDRDCLAVCFFAAFISVLSAFSIVCTFSVWGLQSDTSPSPLILEFLSQCSVKTIFKKNCIIYDYDGQSELSLLSSYHLPIDTFPSFLYLSIYP